MIRAFTLSMFSISCCLFITTPARCATLFDVLRGGHAVAYVVGVTHLDRAITMEDELRVRLDASGSMSSELGLEQFISAQREVEILVRRSMGQQSLEDIVGPDVFSDIAQALEIGSERRYELQHMHPFIASSEILRLRCPIHLGGAIGGEATLILEAEHRRLPVDALESVAEQFESWPIPTSVLWRKHLEAVLRFSRRSNCAATAAATADELFAAMNSGDLNAAFDALQRSYLDLDVKDFDDYAIRGRNQRLAERMRRRIESGEPRPPIFLIGVAHLIGPGNIPEVLTRQGFSVRQVK